MKCKLTLPEKLKDLRVEHGLSLEQLAESTKISRSALGTYETDETREIGGGKPAHTGRILPCIRGLPAWDNGHQKSCRCRSVCAEA